MDAEGQDRAVFLVAPVFSASTTTAIVDVVSDQVFADYRLHGGYLLVIGAKTSKKQRTWWRYLVVGGITMSMTSGCLWAKWKRSQCAELRKR